MAAVNGLEGEADRLCVLLVQPVRHLAGFSLLELLAVSVLIREMFFLLSFRVQGGGGKLNLSKNVFKDVLRENARFLKPALCIVQNSCCLYKIQLKKMYFYNEICFSLCDGVYH